MKTATRHTNSNHNSKQTDSWYQQLKVVNRTQEQLGKKKHELRCYNRQNTTQQKRTRTKHGRRLRLQKQPRTRLRLRKLTRTEKQNKRKAGQRQLGIDSAELSSDSVKRWNRNDPKLSYTRHSHNSRSNSVKKQWQKRLGKAKSETEEAGFKENKIGSAGECSFHIIK